MPNLVEQGGNQGTKERSGCLQAQVQVCRKVIDQLSMRGQQVVVQGRIWFDDEASLVGLNNRER